MCFSLNFLWYLQALHVMFNTCMIISFYADSASFEKLLCLLVSSFIQCIKWLSPSELNFLLNNLVSEVLGCTFWLILYETKWLKIHPLFEQWSFLWIRTLRQYIVFVSTEFSREQDKYSISDFWSYHVLGSEFRLVSYFHPLTK